jgi:hypothetical protein
MRNIVRYLPLFLAILLFASACTERARSKDADYILDVFSKHISIGDSKEKLIGFYKQQGWVYDYDKWQHAYLTGVVVKEKDGHALHTVTVKVDMTDDDKVKSFEIGDAWKP